MKEIDAIEMAIKCLESQPKSPENAAAIAALLILRLELILGRK